MHSASFEKFKETIKLLKQASTSTNIPSKNWFDLVEKSHQNIRNFLQGVRKPFEIELKDYAAPLPVAITNAYRMSFENMLPGMSSYYGLSITSFMFDKVPKSHGEKIRDKKWKDVINYYRKNIAKIEDGSEIAKKLSVEMSKLASLWTDAKTKKAKLYATITTDPSAFAMIGHYGPDAQSCFAQGKENNNHKFFLGQHPDTFVMLLTSEPTETELFNNEINLCRLWGITDQNYKVVNVCNYYPRPSLEEGNIRYTIKEAVSQLLGFTSETVGFYDRLFRVTPVYHNNRSDHPINWTLCDPIIRITDVKTYTIDSSAIQFSTSCPNCQEEGVLGFVVDNIRVCKTCHDKAFVCDYTQSKTLNKDYLVQAMLPNGKKGMIHRSRTEDFFICSLHKFLYHISLGAAKLPNGQIASLAAIRENPLYTVCPECNTVHQAGEHCIVCQKSNQSIEEFLEIYNEVLGGFEYSPRTTYKGSKLGYYIPM